VTAWDAVILAGGRAERLGGIDKTALVVHGRSLLGSAVAATDGARARVIVGPHDGGFAVRTVLEEPRWGGPALALAAGLAELPEPPAPYVAVVAADQPAAAAGLRAVLAAALDDEGADGWVARDPDGRDQTVLAVYRRGALQAALDSLAARAALPGASLRRVLSGLHLTAVPLPAEWCQDVDTPQDLERCRSAIPAG
jgi:molybdopterin-guanine dinucleotide biosynthesis protein A